MISEIEKQSKTLIKLINKNDLKGLQDFLSNESFTKLQDDNKVLIILSNDDPLRRAIYKSLECLEIILNALSLRDLSSDQKYKIFTAKFKTNKTLLEEALQKSPLHLKIILENELIKSLNTDKQAAILTIVLSDRKVFFEALAGKDKEYIKVVLESSLCKQLDYTQQLSLFTRIEQHGTLPLFVAIKQNTSENLHTFIDSDIFKQFPRINKETLLKQIDNNGKTILHHVALKGSKYLKVIFDSELLNSLEREQIYSLFIQKDNNDFIPLQNIISVAHKNNDTNAIKAYLKSNSFTLLSEQQKESIIQFNSNSYLDLFIQLGKYDRTIDSFLSSLNSSLAQYYIEVIKEYKKGDELENLAKIVLYPDHLQIVDTKNYSVLYYLCTKGFNTTIIEQYKLKGAKLISPPGYDVEIVDHKHFLFTVEGGTKTVLIVTGSQNQGSIELGLEGAMHQKMLNVISINTNSNDKIVESDIYSIIKNYSARYDIYLFIFNIHGGDGRNDVLLDITRNNQVTTESKVFFSKILKALGTNHPIEILLTSCNGQLATKVIHNILPHGSKFVTLGENTGHDKIHTVVKDVQMIAKTIELADAASINAREINLERILTDYLMHMNIGKGSPTYTVIGSNTSILKEINSSHPCVISLSAVQKINLLSKLCDFNNDACLNIAMEVFNKFAQERKVDIGDSTYLKNLAKQSNSYELGPILAIKFNYALFCDQLWGDTFLLNKEEVVPNDMSFCCNNKNGICIEGEQSFDSFTILPWWQEIYL